MVNNAGVETRTSVLDTTEAQYEKVMEINLKSAFFGTQLAGQADDRPGRGRPDHQHQLGARRLAHARQRPVLLVERGMRMLTRQAGQELGPHNILVVGVGPGAVATPINTSTMTDPAKMKTLDAAIPLGRMADPAEIGSVVAFWPARAAAT